ncbi:MAG TPA: porin family protein [Longimicrobiales bacterium]
MKWKASLFAAVATLVASAASAQSPVFFVKIGPTYAWRSVNRPELESDGMTAFGGGGGVRIGNGRIAFQPEILVTGKGTSRDNDVGETRLRIEYIEVPMLAHLTLGRHGKFAPFLVAGPVVGLEMRCRAQFVEGNSRDEVGCDLSTDATFDRNKVDILAAGGLGLGYSVGGGRQLGLEARYTHGLRNISDNDDDPGFEIRNRSVSVFLSYSFPLDPGM